MLINVSYIVMMYIAILTVPSIGYLPLANTWEFENHHTLHNNVPNTPLYNTEEQYRSLPWEASTRSASTQRSSGKLSYHLACLYHSGIICSGGPTTLSILSTWNPCGSNKVVLW